MTSGVVAAVDLGASSGRVILGHVGDGALRLEEVHRFANEPVVLPTGCAGMPSASTTSSSLACAGAAQASGEVASVGIDSWAVDFGLLGDDGALIGEPWHYRDPRTARGVERVHTIVPPIGSTRGTACNSCPSTRSIS